MIVAKQQEATHEDDPFLTLSEVARRIGKHRSTISRWVRDGLLEASRMPSGLPSVRQSDINRLLSNSALNTTVK